MGLQEAMANIALGVSAAMGAGPYWSAVVRSDGEPEFDDGGSIVDASTPTERTCSAQVDTVSEAMRRAEGYVDRDVRLLVLAGTLSGELDTTQTIEVLTGPNAGIYSIQSVDRDPAGILWDCRGRPQALADDDDG
jgi:hypothetical protein